jgi:hypothetical protein
MPGTPADADFALDPGIDALHRGLSLVGGAWGGGVGRIYIPGSLTYLTVKIWLAHKAAGSPNCISWTFQDCIAAGVMSWRPRQVGRAVAALSVGSVREFEQTDYPTLDYQEQSSTSAPAVQGVGHAWGAERGFQSFELAFDNDIEEIEDSNQPTGVTPRITGRNVNATATIFSRDDDLDYERSKIVDPSASADALSFTVGTPVPTPGAGTALPYRVRLTTPELRTLKPIRVGDDLAWEASWAAVNAVANSEFELIYL